MDSLLKKKIKKKILGESLKKNLAKRKKFKENNKKLKYDSTI